MFRFCWSVGISVYSFEICCLARLNPDLAIPKLTLEPNDGTALPAVEAIRAGPALP